MSQRAAAQTRESGSLDGQLVAVLGGSSGIGRATAELARDVGADLIITGRNAARVEAVGAELGARTATLELSDADGLRAFFDMLSAVDHVLVTGGGPVYAPISELGMTAVGAYLDEHLEGSLRVARECAGRVRPGGSLTFITGTDARRPGVGNSVAGIAAAALPVITANAALELAPIRVNCVAAGYVDTPLSARILGTDLARRRAELAATLPIRRVIEPEDMARAIVHLMTSSAVTGTTFDVDGGQHLL
jgi:NAD(P)-dependent dehydrogenase (short-subunit alcohol dehydrogenase family)